jgi:dolichol kinase
VSDRGAEKLDCQKEIFRKIIHLSVLILPFSYLTFFEKKEMIFISAFLLVGFLTADLLRLNFSLAQVRFQRVFSPLLRNAEKKNKITGATWLFAGIFVTFLLFPKEIAVVSVYILIISDSAAAIVGKGVGKIKIAEKTLEGSLAFFFSTVVILIRFYSFSIAILCVAIIVTLTELMPLKINDNFLIPLLSGSLIFFMQTYNFMV